MMILRRVDMIFGKTMHIYKKDYEDLKSSNLDLWIECETQMTCENIKR